STNGTGPAGSFTGRVDVNGKLNAQVGGVMNRATPIAWGRINTQTFTLIAGSGNVTAGWVNGVGLRAQVFNESDPSHSVILSSVQYGPSVPNGHLWTSYPGYQAADGTFPITASCENCGAQFPSEDVTVSFVVYQGN